ncbi:outer membrane beta-barrel protein [Aquimarina gracilis]|uniref:Outer membrane beta-barrel protein n=1 Tax=Aquimarina gracilis TaxID=874422 RepID=A0ABU5ZPF4_9FLAO|nr:outer membrane beta-barrel protein [Aquimarina gracilis]MEB3343834.1 outer membrane beta-barrel protein [Aquimarina gracilis]
MKTTLFFCIASLLFFSKSFAQEEPDFGFKKGDVFISGSLSYNKTNFENNNDFDEDRSRWVIQPRIGYFINSNFAIGTRLSYSKFKSDNSQDFSSDGSDVGIGIFGRYYFTPQKRFSIYADASASYFRGKSEQEFIFNDQIEITEIENDSYAVAISPGIQFFVSEKFALTSSIGSIEFSISEGETINPDGERFTRESDNFSINLGLDNIFLGILYRI